MSLLWIRISAVAEVVEVVRDRFRFSYDLAADQDYSIPMVMGHRPQWV